MALPKDVTNPGSVNVADQGYDFLAVPDQPVTVSSPASSAVRTVDADDGSTRPVSVDQPVTVSSPASTAVRTVSGNNGSRRPVSVDQPITVTTPGPPLLTVQAGSFSPDQAGAGPNITQNNVAGQTFGTGLPANVFV